MQINQITFTRFIAALSVVFFHYGMHTLPESIPWLKNSITAGPTAVNYFFVLSGFIMAIAYYHVKPTNQLAKKKYWLARFARIYPVYMIALLLMAAASFSELGKNVLALPLHLTMLQAWLPGYPMTLNNPGWSLSVEAFFYLCFPFILAMVYRLGLKYLAIATVITWFITQYVLLSGINNPEYIPGSSLHDFIYYNPLMHINAFLAGLFCGILFKKNADSISSPKTIWLISSIALIIILLETQPLIESTIGFKIAYTNGLIAPAFLLFIWLLASTQGRVQKWLSHPLLILLGEASFSIYILQKPIFGLYNKILEKRLALGDVADFYVALTLLIIISIASYKLFETPARNLINKSFN